MASLEELYVCINQGENVNEIAEQLLKLYEDPQFILEILEIISTNQDQSIRLQAAIQLQYPLKKNWERICNDPMSLEIKSSILAALSNEPSMHVRKNILYSMSFMISQQCPWPELQQFILNLFELNNQIQTETALNVLYYWIPSFTHDDFYSLAGDIGQYIINAIAADSFDIQIAGYQLFEQSVGFFQEPLQQPFTDILENLYKVFHELMVEGDERLYQIGNVIERVIMSNHNCIGLDQIINSHIELSLDESISPEYYFSIFSPLSTLIATIDDGIKLLMPHVDDLLKAIFLCISKSLNDDCHTKESISEYIALLIDDLIDCMNNEKLYAHAEAFFSHESINEAYAVVVILTRFLELSPSVAIKHSAEIAPILLQYANSECNHTVFEVSLVAISLLIQDLEDKMNVFSKPIIKACLNAIETEHYQLILNALNTLHMALTELEFDSDFLEVLATTIPELITIEDEQIITAAIPAITALISKAEKDIIPYVPQFLQNIHRLAQFSEETYPTIKAYAIEALAQLIAVAPEEVSEIIQPSLEIFKECMENTDSVIVDDLLRSLSILASAKFEGIEEILQVIIEFASAQLDCEYLQNAYAADGFDINEDPDTVAKISDSIINSLSVFERIVDNSPEVFAPHSEEVATKAMGFTNYPSPLIVQSALSLLSAIIVTYKFDPNDFLNTLLNEDAILDEPEYISVASMFEFCKDIINADLLISEELFKKIFLSALKAIDHTLPFFDFLNAETKIREEEDDDDFDFNDEGEVDIDDDVGQDEGFDDDFNDQSKYDVVESVFELLSVCVIKMTELFNSKILAKLIDTIKRAQKKNLTLEIIYSTDLLGQIFELNRPIFKGLILKFSLNIIKDSLSLCDGTNKPCPLTAFRRIILTDFSVLEAIFLQIISITNAVLQLENEGQSFYEETISGAVSLLFALLKIQGQQFPIDDYFSTMLQSLPSKYNAEFVYDTLLSLCIEAKEIVEPFINEIIRIFSQTLSLKDSDLKKYKLTDETLTNMLKILMMFIQSVPNWQEMISEFVNDPRNQEILKSRLEAAASDEQ